MTSHPAATTTACSATCIQSTTPGRQIARRARRARAAQRVLARAGRGGAWGRAASPLPARWGRNDNATPLGPPCAVSRAVSDTRVHGRLRGQCGGGGGGRGSGRGDGWRLVMGGCGSMVGLQRQSHHRRLCMHCNPAATLTIWGACLTGRVLMETSETRDAGPSNVNGETTL